MSVLQFFNWFAVFLGDTVDVVINDCVTPDGFSFGGVCIGIAILSAVVSGTIGAVAIFGRNHSITVSNRYYEKGGD